jgi:purine nucleosidase
VVNGQEIEQILALQTKFGEFTVRSNDTASGALLRQTGEVGIALPDPTAMAILLDPALSLAASDHYMDVQIDSGITRGMSVVDRLGVAEDGRNRGVWSEVIERGRKQTVIWEMDNAGWKQALLRALR